MKTPALRLLDQKKIPYTAHHYEIQDGLLDGKSVVKKLGIDEDTLYKTLVLQSAEKKIFVVLVPVSKELDLKKAACFLQVKKLNLLPLKELKPLTGYEKGGCSPLAMKKAYPVYLDEVAKNKTTIYVNGGAIGISIELSPKDLERVVDLSYLEL